MSGPLGSSQWMYSSGSDYEIDQSLKLEDGRAPKLTFTPTTAGNRKKITVSVWAKRGKLGASNSIISSGGRFDTAVVFDANDKIQVFTNYAENYRGIQTSAVFRDTSAWYHIVASWDTNNATSTDRHIVWVNGVRQAVGSEVAIPQDVSTELMNTTEHTIGTGGRYQNQNQLDGYLAEMHVIDGQVLAPTYFGETGDYGEWKPIEYEGTYGTNGFYLPFKQDYTVEGFSTVTYKGAGVVRYVGGTGFQPDLVWIKSRDHTYGHHLTDAVRGVGKDLYTDTTEDDYDNANSLQSFESDGFTLGTDNGPNNSTKQYVAWTWDMGSPAPKQITANGNAKISTTQEKFGSSSAYFDGTGDYLSIPQSYDFDLAAKTNYTVECWVYHTDTIGGDRVYVSQTEGAYSNSWYFRAVSGGEVNLTAWEDGSDFLSVRTGAGVVTQNNWHHVALVKTGTNYKIFVDGTDETDSGGTDSDTATFHTGELRIGDNGSGQYMTGYIDEIRISDTARYSSNFTPSASAFTRDSNTKLLMHNEGANNSTEFLDHSGMDVNTDGSITSNVKANTTYGQSIVSYTGTGSNATIGHGLSSAPEWIIIKRRDADTNWPTWHTSISDGTDDFVELNSSGDKVTNEATFFTSTDPTNSVFSVGSSTQTNANNATHIAYCWHSVTGYSSFGSYTGNGNATGPTITTGFRPAFVMIKVVDRTDGGNGGWFMYDNTRNPNTGDTTAMNNVLMANSNAVELVDDSNLALDFTSTGFQLKASYDEVNVNGGTYIYMAFADKREYAYWLDQSGNNNDWTSNSLTESDISVDSPTNNFATLNPLAPRSGYGVDLSEGNLKQTQDIYESVQSTFQVSSGKWYMEVNYADYQYGLYAGINQSDNASRGDWTYSIMFGSDGNANVSGYNSWTANWGDTWNVDGTILGIAVNFDDNEVKFFLNGDVQGTISNRLVTDGSVSYGMFLSDGRNSDIYIANFGQDSSFAGTKTPQGYQDSNGIGDFYYEPPSDHLALCTKNLPDVDVVPSEHFNTVLYSGNGNTANDGNVITGVGFQPDFLWVKNRNGNNIHSLQDAVRGVRAVIQSQVSEGENATRGYINSFTADGFNTGNAAGASINPTNGSGLTYVAWNWKANGSGSTDNSGNLDATVSANTDANFSIVTYTGTGGEPKTVAHGLGVSPEMVIIKRRNNGNAWVVWHKDLADNYAFEGLNTTGAAVSGGSPISKYVDAVSSTLVSVGDASEVNANTGTYVMYCWASVDGYSKVGSYTGNGNADGTFVYTGFRPAYILYKSTDNVTHWSIHNNKSNPYNVADLELHANEIATEASAAEYKIDFLSNGFKQRNTNGTNNGNGYNYIYIAFAEVPFKFANAR